NIRLDADIQNLDLNRAMHELLEGKPVEWLMENETIVIKSNRPERTHGMSKSLKEGVQQKTITGEVTDARGLALQGVTVMVKGTSSATSTDEEGKYSLPVSENAQVLVFSIVGYMPAEREIANNVIINVSLQQRI